MPYYVLHFQSLLFNHCILQNKLEKHHLKKAFLQNISHVLGQYFSDSTKGTSCLGDITTYKQQTGQFGLLVLLKTSKECKQINLLRQGSGFHYLSLCFIALSISSIIILAISRMSSYRKLQIAIICLGGPPQLPYAQYFKQKHAFQITHIIPI